ncbi:MAG: hypothetical protein BLITH_1372 [Brockia lithotrophica]|uniref:Uncharacterized protein n=1 Tax=Brockia lithotrophica TaxID=933949 RepID=A0A2T5G6C5_9BACL|nr:MAG: hypothetical protein BLITH_1372 [Brockia lithotrophica]
MATLRQFLGFFPMLFLLVAILLFRVFPLGRHLRDPDAPSRT